MAKTKKETANPKCGIVMPISETDGCPESHWKDVLDIIQAAVTKTNFEANLVSEGSDVGVIHKRIVLNLYENPVVICDVSGKNPNVMFELGMRLAFDKPVIIIKDDKTNYSFDTSPVEHLTYPRDLRFSQVVDFQQKLSDKIISSGKGGNKNSFLNSFGTFKVAQIETESVPQFEIFAEDLNVIKNQLREIMSDAHSAPSQIGRDSGTITENGYKSQKRALLVKRFKITDHELELDVTGQGVSKLEFRLWLLNFDGVKDVSVRDSSRYVWFVLVELDHDANPDDMINNIVGKINSFSNFD